MSETEDQPGRCTVCEQERVAFTLAALDIDGCGVVSIHTAINEFERKHPGQGHRFDTWHPELQRVIAAEFDAWRKRNPARAIRLVSSALHQGVAVLIVHHV